MTRVEMTQSEYEKLKDNNTSYEDSLKIIVDIKNRLQQQGKLDADTLKKLDDLLKKNL